MFGVICPTCAFNQNKSKSERLDIASKLISGKHYICDSCGCYMYQTLIHGTKWFFDMEDIMFFVVQDEERIDRNNLELSILV